MFKGFNNINPLFILKKLTKKYPQIDSPVFDIDYLPIPRGKLISVLGNSGCGKTTLLKMLGILDTPYPIVDNTEIEFYSKRTCQPIKYSCLYNKDFEKQKLKKEKIRLNFFGYLFEEAFLFNNLNILKNVEIPMLLKGCNKKISLKKAKTIIDVLELSQNTLHGNKSIFELSKGERQRIALLRACLHNPEIIFADEPTGNLDDYNAELVFLLLTKWLELAPERTAIIITHDINLALRFSNYILVFDRERKQHILTNKPHNKIDEAKTGKISLLMNSNDQLEIEHICNDIYIENVKKETNKLELKHKKVSDIQQKAQNLILKNKTAINETFSNQSNQYKSIFTNRFKFLWTYAFKDLFELPQKSNSIVKNLINKISAIFRPLINIGTLLMLMCLSVFFYGLLNGTSSYLNSSIEDPSICGIRVEREGNVIDEQLIKTVIKTSMIKNNNKKQIVFDKSTNSVFTGSWGHYYIGFKILKAGKNELKSKKDYYVAHGITTLANDSIIKNLKPIYGAKFQNNNTDGLFISYELFSNLGYKSFEEIAENENKLILLYSEDNHFIPVPIVGISDKIDKDFYVTEGFAHRWNENEYNPDKKIGRFSIKGFKNTKDAIDYQKIARNFFPESDFRVERIELLDNIYSFDITTRYKTINKLFIKEGKFHFMQEEWKKISNSSFMPELTFPKEEMTPYEPGQIQYLNMIVYPKSDYLNLNDMKIIQKALFDNFKLKMDFSGLIKLIQIADINKIFTMITNIIIISLAIFSLVIIYLTFSESIHRKYKKLGIQKAIGIKSSEIIIMYNIQAFYIWFFSFIFFCIIAYLAYLIDISSFIASYFENVEVKKFFSASFMSFTWIITIIITLFICLCSATIAVLRFSFKEPAELLLDKE